jgi:hypothetical protein
MRYGNANLSRRVKHELDILLTAIQGKTDIIVKIPGPDFIQIHWHRRMLEKRFEHFAHKFQFETPLFREHKRLSHRFLLNSRANRIRPILTSRAQPASPTFTLKSTARPVAYKMTDTDKGHKDVALNATDHSGCLDTFVKRSGQWYLVGTACSPSEPLPQAQWNATQKAMAQQTKDVQDAYH